MRDLTVGSVTGHLVHMSLFIGAGMLVQTLYFLVDLYFVARLGKDALAGVSGAGNVLFVVMALTLALGVATVTLIAHAAGRKDPYAAMLVFNQAWCLSVIGMVMTLAAGYGLSAFYMALISADLEAAAFGRTYLHWFLPGLALQFPIAAMSSGLRGTGIVRPTTTIQIGSLLLNCMLAPVLIAGWGTGYPLGVAGAALASTIAIGLGAVALVLYFRRRERYISVDASFWWPNLSLWKRMANIGLPAGAEFGFIFIFHSVVYWCLQPFGTAAQAGFGVGNRVLQSIFLPVMAVAFAASPIAGQNFGAQQGDRVRATFRSATLTGVLIMVALTLLCQWRPELLIRGFANDPQVTDIGAEFLRVTSWNFVAIAITFTCSALFRAIGNTWPALLSGLLRLLLFALLAMWLSVQPGTRIAHFWYLSVVTMTLQAVLSLWLVNLEFRRRLVFAPKPVPVA